jgi:hypothetical protein
VSMHASMYVQCTVDRECAELCCERCSYVTPLSLDLPPRPSTPITSTRPEPSRPSSIPSIPPFATTSRPQSPQSKHTHSNYYVLAEERCPRFTKQRNTGLVTRPVILHNRLLGLGLRRRGWPGRRLQSGFGVDFLIGTYTVVMLGGREGVARPLCFCLTRLDLLSFSCLVEGIWADIIN